MTAARDEVLRQRLLALGFDEVRFAAATTAGDEPGLGSWLKEGMHAEMGWMARTAEKRSNVDLVLPGVKSVILLGVNYAADRPVRNHPAAEGTRPVWARYALHEDYHDTIKPALVAAGRAIEELWGAGAADYRYYVDTGPVLERSWAARAGLGFIGKNAMLISRRHGNWLFLAAILTRVGLTPDAPLGKPVAASVGEGRTSQEGIGLLCGKCTRCLDACPTQALARPGVVDARRCISYQTIENKGAIPRELRAGIGAHVYGCDVCLEVCPWNRFAREGRAVLLVARRELAGVGLDELLGMTPTRFAEVFRKTAIKRLKLAGLLRNACIVAGNSGDLSLLPRLVVLASHDRALVRAHAVWAVFRLAGAERAKECLAAARRAEADATVLSEYLAEG